MELLVPLVAVISLGLLAIRFGVDSRPGIRSHEHDLVDSGMFRDASSQPAVMTRTAAAAADGPAIKQLVWAQTLPAQSGSPSSPYPMLRALDLARDPGQPAFATDPNAALLETRARQLTDLYWSELAWLTGLIDKAQFDAVCDALERERLAPHGIEVFILSDQQPLIAS